MKTQLYGHVSKDTAYMIEDYPCGFTARCKKRVWLEYNPKKGYRFVSQTTNKSGQWCAEKKGTYTPGPATLYLDEQGHVQWASCGYSLKSITDYGKDFTLDEVGKNVTIAFLKETIRIGNQALSGERVWIINGKEHGYSPAEKESYKADIQLAEEILKELT